MEADLQRFYGIPLADVYTGRLSLRRLSVLVAQLPHDSASVRLAADLAPGWDTKAFLLADIFMAVTGKPHPSRPNPKKTGDKSRAARLRRALEAQRKRAAKKEAS